MDRGKDDLPPQMQQIPPEVVIQDLNCEPQSPESPTPKGSPGSVKSPQHSFSALDEVPNPFAVQHEMNCYEWVKVVVGSLILVPIRLSVLLAVLLVWAFPLCMLLACCTACRGAPDGAPPNCLQRCLLLPIRGGARVILWCFGFWWIRYDQLTEETAPIIVAASHMTLLDAFILFYLEMPAFVAHDGVASIPLVGPVTRALGCGHNQPLV